MPHSTDKLSMDDGGKTILVAEDSKAIRKLVAQVLGAQGYTVLEASDGASALQASEAHRGDIHLLLTDVVMPGLGGPELAARLRERRPELKVLLVTGMPDPDGHRGFETLPKPFTAAGLSERVRQLLEGD